MDRSGAATRQEAMPAGTRTSGADSGTWHYGIQRSGADEGTIGGQDFRRPAESNARGPEEFEETPPLLLAKVCSGVMKIFSICCVRDENDIIGETLEAANLERQDICV